MTTPKIIAVALLLLQTGCADQQTSAEDPISDERRIVIESRGWELIGDLRLPPSDEPVPAVLMLNKAAGDRTVYAELAEQLAARGIASLRLDLPGHGESINLGSFVPEETDSLTRESMIWESAVEFLRTQGR